MILIYIVELESTKTFTSRKTVKNESEANFAVEKLVKENKKKGRVQYSGFKLYDQLNIVNQTPKILKTWQDV